MRSLVLCTATEKSIAAIVENSKILVSAELPAGLQNSKYLLPELQKGIKEQQISLQQIDFIAVGIGPGSYTGIRVGVTCAKALAFALHKPLVGVCSLELFVPEQEGDYAVLIDAKIGGAYLFKASLHAGKVVPKQPPGVFPLTEIPAFIGHTPLILTPQAASLKMKLAALFPNHHWEWQEQYPSATHLAACAEEKLAKGEFSLDGRLELLYMRKTQAEIERKG